LPVLGTLNVSNWSNKELRVIGHDFPTVRTLGVAEKRLSTRSALQLVNACPNLSELRLYNSRKQKVTRFEVMLSLVQPRIHRLYLTSATSSPLTQAAFANFSQLRYLRLSADIFPEDLHRCLDSLEELEELALQSAKAAVPSEELLKFVNGPRKLTKLRNISLEIAEGCIGQRVNPFTPEGIEVIESQEYERWIGDYSDEGEWFTGPVMRQGHEEWSKCERLLATAKENGVLVTGGLLKGLETLHAHLIEVNNLSVVRAFYHSNFHTIPRARQFALDHRFPLPELDIDSIDPKKLELVKVEMEEYGWFALTLRNKE